MKTTTKIDALNKLLKIAERKAKKAERERAEEKARKAQ